LAVGTLFLGLFRGNLAPELVKSKMRKSPGQNHRVKITRPFP